MWITTAVGSKLHVWTTQKQSRTGIKSLRTPGRRKLRCCSDTLHGIGVKKQTFNITLGTYMQIIFSNDMFVIKSFWRNELKNVLWVWLGHFATQQKLTEHCKLYFNKKFFKCFVEFQNPFFLYYTCHFCSISIYLSPMVFSGRMERLNGQWFDSYLND